MHNLQLSTHGIWYFRKVTITASGKRKEIKRSLRTRSKVIAKQKALALLNCTVSVRNDSARVLSVADASQSITSSITTIDFNKSLDTYLKFKANDVSLREVSNIKRCCTRYLSSTNNPLSKKSASAFLDSLALSATTKNKHADKVGSFFKWLSARTDEPMINPFEGIRHKVIKSASEQRTAYTKFELMRLLAIARTLPKHKEWIIKIAAYTGMRATEIVQLSADDIKQVDGIWCIDINDIEKWQSLKNKNSRRIIPMHQELEPFVLYAKSRVGRVFPEFKYNEGHPCARYFTKWFSTFKKREVLPEFHSIRHYVATTLKAAGAPLQYAAAMLGHSNNSITYDRYGKAISPVHLVGLLKHLSYE